MSWLVALSHIISVLSQFLQSWRNRKHERIGADLEKSHKNFESIEKTRRARNARLVERINQRADIDRLHQDDGFKR